jgi:hypothetical protein
MGRPQQKFELDAEKIFFTHEILRLSKAKNHE